MGKQRVVCFNNGSLLWYRYQCSECYWRLKYKVSGSAPNRTFTIIYNDVPLFSCNSELANQEIIFYEIDNSFEVHIKSKPACSWNGGLAVLGIQNEELLPDTCGYYPGDATSPTLPNRNTGVWTIDEWTLKHIICTGCQYNLYLDWQQW